MDPRAMADTAMPTSMPDSGTPISASMPPHAITMGNVTGNSHTAGGPNCAPQTPTAIIASTWSRPDIGWYTPLLNPSASPPLVCAKAVSGHASSIAYAQRAHGSHAEAYAMLPPGYHRIPPNSMAVRWMV